MGENSPDYRSPVNTYYDTRTGGLSSYQDHLPDDLAVDSFTSRSLPLILTADMQRYKDYFKIWFHSKPPKPFLVVGPQGSGKR